MNGRNRRQIFRMIIVAAIVLHLFSCIFLGQSYMPDVMDMAH
jgi:hypothetical protein